MFLLRRRHLCRKATFKMPSYPPKALLFPFAIAPIQVMPAAPCSRIGRLLKCQNKAAAGSNAGSCCYAYAWNGSEFCFHIIGIRLLLHPAFNKKLSLSAAHFSIKCYGVLSGVHAKEQPLCSKLACFCRPSETAAFPAPVRAHSALRKAPAG